MARNLLSPFRTPMLTERGLYGDPFLSLHREMNRLFDDVLRGATGVPNQTGAAGMALVPHVDVSETDGEMKIVAELPGVRDEDVDVSLHDDLLTIRGEKKSERKDDKENYHVVERSFGSFQRSLRLPFSVDPTEVQADFNNGVLTITIPKGKEREHMHRIQIGRGQAAPAGSQTAPDTMQDVAPKTEQRGSDQPRATH